MEQHKFISKLHFHSHSFNLPRTLRIPQSRYILDFLTENFVITGKTWIISVSIWHCHFFFPRYLVSLAAMRNYKSFIDICIIVIQSVTHMYIRLKKKKKNVIKTKCKTSYVKTSFIRILIFTKHNKDVNILVIFRGSILKARLQISSHGYILIFCMQRNFFFIN